RLRMTGEARRNDKGDGEGIKVMESEAMAGRANSILQTRPESLIYRYATVFKQYNLRRLYRGFR
ncbi:MAG: hypothetical protein ACTSRS_22730, partial [Candidatus Helarchaeota archaeon]